MFLVGVHIFKSPERAFFQLQHQFSYSLAYMTSLYHNFWWHPVPFFQNGSHVAITEGTVTMLDLRWIGSSTGTNEELFNLDSNCNLLPLTCYIGQGWLEVRQMITDQSAFTGGGISFLDRWWRLSAWSTFEKQTLVTPKKDAFTPSSGSSGTFPHV